MPSAVCFGTVKQTVPSGYMLPVSVDIFFLFSMIAAVLAFSSTAGVFCSSLSDTVSTTNAVLQKSFQRKQHQLAKRQQICK